MSNRTKEEEIARDLFERNGAVLSITDVIKFTGRSREFVKKYITNDLDMIGGYQGNSRTYYYRDVARKIAGN